MIYIKQKDYGCLLRHCVQELPNEACGLLGGIWDAGNARVEKVYLLENMDADAGHFSMNPKEQFASIRDMRECGYVMLGNFHSHPKAPASPSEEDRRLAFDSSVYYLILSLEDREHPVLNAFVIDREKNVLKEEIVYV